MKIILDNDGTLTDFNKFVENNAIKYFEKKYGMKVIYPNKLEIEDIFDMKNFFIQKGYNEIEANKKVRIALDKFWISFKFIKFSLLNKFRKGAKDFINKKLKSGDDIQIHTSRAKTCQNDIIGKIARKFTILQYRLNGIKLPAKNFHFYINDQEKIKGIISSNPDLVFDDKPEIINKLSELGINTICVRGTHNNNIVETKNIAIINDFSEEELNKKIEKCIGVKNLKVYERINKSNKFYKKIRIIRPVILNTFNPIILNSQNISNEDGKSTIYAPNHRSTLDPLVITAIVNLNIHWAALLRFFEGRDSIFNNSKNPLLCKITSKTFKKLEYFPIDRKCDNPNANNYNSIKDMNNFLKLNQTIGIFGEGTTRRPIDSKFGKFDDSFMILAKKNNSIVRPVTTLWIKELGIKQKVIINFGEPFNVENMSVKEAMEHFMYIQNKLLDENVEYKNNIEEKIKSKKLF